MPSFPSTILKTSSSGIPVTSTPRAATVSTASANENGRQDIADKSRNRSCKSRAGRDATCAVHCQDHIQGLDPPGEPPPHTASVPDSTNV